MPIYLTIKSDYSIIQSVNIKTQFDGGIFMNKSITLSDFHLHSYYSSDSKSSPESMVKEAIDLGLSSICFTDHNDFDYPKDDEKIMFQLDLPSYMKEMMELRTRYEGVLPIYIGLEQGLQKKSAHRINHYGEEYDFDFIIGSSHVVDGVDPYYKSYWDGITIKEGIQKYFLSIIENIKICDKFDVYGHIDYIIRYIPDKNFIYNYYDYRDIVEEALSLLIQKGKGIEINTSGLKYGLNQTHPCTDIIKKYKELGGEIITIGSDGHKPEHLAYAFEKIPEILKSSGFDYYTIFKNRKPVFIKI